MEPNLYINGRDEEFMRGGLYVIKQTCNWDEADVKGVREGAPCHA